MSSGHCTFKSQGIAARRIVLQFSPRVQHAGSAAGQVHCHNVAVRSRQKQRCLAKGQGSDGAVYGRHIMLQPRVPTAAILNGFPLRKYSLKKKLIRQQ